MITIRSARYLLFAVVAVTLVTSTFGQVPTYTGCYSPSSGIVNKLALGSAPQKTCNTGDVLVSFSAGDITKISVSGGLSGGGDNGDVTISLDPKYSLPQNCPANSVAKWTGTAWLCAKDENTTYSAGTGLNLSGADNTFSLLAEYQLPQNCSAGSILKARTGYWVCASEAGVHAYTASSRVVDITNNTDATIASLSVPPNAYIILGNVEVANYDKDEQSVTCRLYKDGTELRRIDVRLGGHNGSLFDPLFGGLPDPTGDYEAAGFLPVSLQSWGTVGQTISMKCGTYKGAAQGNLIAIAVDAIH
jgi:hypothetical protein